MKIYNMIKIFIRAVILIGIFYLAAKYCFGEKTFLTAEDFLLFRKICRDLPEWIKIT